MHSINNPDDRIANNSPLMADTAFHPGPILRAPSNPVKQNLMHVKSSLNSNVKDINPNINFDFEDNSPFQEGIMSQIFQRLDK